MSDTNRTAIRYAKEPYFAAPIGGAYASGTVSFSGAPSNNDTVTINGVVYTFKTTPAAARDVALGTSAATAAQNLADAINANPATTGTAYYVTTPADANVIAYAVSSVVTLYARLHGTGGNSLTLAESGASTTVSGGTLSGGLASNYATMTALRYNSHTLRHQKVTVESEEIRSDRTAFGMVKVGIGAGGGVQHEMHWGDLTNFICSAMMQPIASSSSTATDWSITSGVLAKGAGMPAALLNAKFVKMSGWSNATNNGIKRVISISGNTLTLEGTFVNEGPPSPSVTVAWSYSRQGVTLESYLLETEQADVGIVVPLTGMCVNQWSMEMTPRSKIMTGFEWLGYGLPSGSVSRTDTCGNAVAAPSLNPIINTTSHIARLLQNGNPSRAFISQLNWSINNNLRERLAVGREGTLVPGTGEASITGTINSYFDNKFDYDDFLNHLDVGLEFTMQDSAGRIINVYCPAIQLGEGTYDVPGRNQDVFLNRTFKAKKGVGHDTTQFQAQVDILEP